MHPHLSPVVSYPKWPLESDLSFNLWTLTGSVILGYLIFLSLFHYFKEKKIKTLITQDYNKWNNKYKMTSRARCSY